MEVTVSLVMLLLVMSATFQGCFSEASQPPSKKKSTQRTAANGFGSSAFFPITGNVYPLGYYSVSLNIGNPPKVFEFDIDTGSDLTWVQCDAPCSGCTMPRDHLFKPRKDLLVNCRHPACAAVHYPESPQCERPGDQCDFEVEYVDHGSVLGVLVSDEFPFRLANGSVFHPRLIFGCAYNLKHPDLYSPPSTAGVLGLGNGKAGILSQLNDLHITRNVIGHCLSGDGGGFLFIGDDLIPSSGVVWMPMLGNDRHYLSSLADLFFDGKPTSIKGLKVVFDSGSSYTYFNSQFYEGILKLISKDLNGKPVSSVKDQALPICWKGPKPFKSISELKNYFGILTLSFTKAKNIQLQLPPENYLIITEHGNACLGILNGTEVGLDNFNIIGDISLQDKMVIYDNEKQQIGWVFSDCKRLPSVDGDYEEDFLQPYAANFGIMEEHFPAAEASWEEQHKRKSRGKVYRNSK